MATATTNSQRAAALVVAVVSIDLATKAAAALLDRTPTSGIITPVHNPDYSLGLIHADPIVLMSGTVAVLITAAWWYHRAASSTVSSRTWWVGPVVLGGTIANLVDRAMFGSVHDFITTPWIVFNLADVAVLIGLVGFYRDHFTHQHHTGGGEPHEQPA